MCLYPLTMELGTFSIVARDRKKAEFGVASATAAPCVGAFLPHVLEGVGAIASQAWVNVNLGYQGLQLMASGLSVQVALEALLMEDNGRARRQVIGIDASSAFGYTGDECSGAKGHLLEDEFAVAGNILADVRVLHEMAEAFKKSRGELSQKLMAALEAGQVAGGDHRGKLSSVLVVASPHPRLYHNLRVDLSDNPVADLRGLYSKCEHLQEEIGDLEDGEILRRRVHKVDMLPPIR